jgi:hypothetical protein
MAARKLLPRQGLRKLLCLNAILLIGFEESHSRRQFKSSESLSSSQNRGETVSLHHVCGPDADSGRLGKSLIRRTGLACKRG